MAKPRFSWVYIVIATLVGALLSFAFLRAAPIPEERSPVPTAAVVVPAPARGGNCGYNISRISGYRMVRPLLSLEPVCESERFDSIRSGIANLVGTFQRSGVLTSASVYLRDFRKGDWMWYNGSETFDPGSMMKVPVLMTILAMQEEDPGSLDRTYTCAPIDLGNKEVYFPSFHAVPGSNYTMRQLLEFMIVNSDNVATGNIMRVMPEARFLRTFSDLGLTPPDSKTAYPITARDYSVFIKALYNGSLLGPKSSEMALSLLARSDFREGLLKELPTTLQVAHKFGEAGSESEKELHESGLVYLNGNPYLITVMTRGKDMHQLPQVISGISKLVYDRMARM